jgi:predicted helicase
MKENIEKILKEGNIEKKVGLYLGGMKEFELKASEECDIIIGTYSLAHEGLDIPKLDTLILSTPKSDIVQSVGRILRETKTKKNDPIVIDIVDMWGIFEYQYYKRQKFYRKTGFMIKETCVNI